MVLVLFILRCVKSDLQLGTLLGRSVESGEFGPLASCKISAVLKCQPSINLVLCWPWFCGCFLLNHFGSRVASTPNGPTGDRQSHGEDKHIRVPGAGDSADSSVLRQSRHQTPYGPYMVFFWCECWLWVKTQITKWRVFFSVIFFV